MLSPDTYLVANYLFTCLVQTGKRIKEVTEPIGNPLVVVNRPYLL